jgi:hypothetical protein
MWTRKQLSNMWSSQQSNFVRIIKQINKTFDFSADGGEVMLDREYFLDNKLHKKSALLPIEWVLAKTYGFDEKDIECINFLF